MRKKRVLHLSTAHSPRDPRIVYKQCPALAERYEVWCALPRADPSAAPEVRFIRLPRFRRVVWRVLLTSPYILLRTFFLRPAIVHIYMPDLLPLAFIYRLLGSRVIYEVQENIYKKVAIKRHNRSSLLQRFFRGFDEAARRCFYFIFTEHGYLQTYDRLRHPSVIVYNYPIVADYQPYRATRHGPDSEINIFYLGGISFERAIDTVINGLARLRQYGYPFRMHLFGPLAFPEKELETIPAYSQLRQHLVFYGYTDQQRALPIAAQSLAGLALLKPVADYPESYPTKLFEYMALGLPVITSRFPLYREVVERHRCGFCIDPHDPQALADCLRFLIENPAEAEAMGERGRVAAERYYTWETERRKLLDFYQLIEF